MMMAALEDQRELDELFPEKYQHVFQNVTKETVL
jgi:hypothetical protein